MLTQFGAEFLRESLESGSLVAVGNSGEFDAPYGVYGCAGEDQWCVICVRDTDDWHRLCATIGADDLAADVDLGTATGRSSTASQSMSASGPGPPSTPLARSWPRCRRPACPLPRWPACPNC
jgi:crotonobetainyl-CoA:carnitine CoA-transferase CaiB-like acyl-CoA transferase